MDLTSKLGTSHAHTRCNSYDHLSCVLWYGYSVYPRETAARGPHRIDALATHFEITMTIWDCLL